MTGSPTAVDHHDHDPRPVFEGDWATASGTEKGDHSERVRQWKERHGLGGVKRTGQGAKAQGDEAQGRMAALLGERAADVSALQALIDAPGTLGSDRIRAIEAKQRILARAEEEEREAAHGPLVALRHALDALPEAQRVDALSGLLAVGSAHGAEAQSDEASPLVAHAPRAQD